MSYSKYSIPFNKNFVEEILESIIYDIVFQQPNSVYKLEEIKANFLKVLQTLLPQERAVKLNENFFNEIFSIKKDLEKLIFTYYNNDPASKSEIEIILSYPGFFATAIYKLANFLYILETPILPRFFSEYAHKQTGIDINPGAKIGKNFYIDHGTGIVIGETTVIGDNVKIYQGVTLGAFYVSKDLADKKRHPTIGDNVTIYAGATILGGTTVIGENTIVGGNVWVTKSVEPNSIVYQETNPIIKQINNNANDEYFI